MANPSSVGVLDHCPKFVVTCDKVSCIYIVYRSPGQDVTLELLVKDGRN
jgi:hypothetical protein